ncbi:MAG: hypothetical protein HRU06_19405 [Oceanospirillaceae bacterium]|nr:hypothetical protein [Oceanospirillaceae bacterium]
MQAQHLRHQYLATLGIDSWLSRAPLPNAAPSEPWVAQFVYDESVLDQCLAVASAESGSTKSEQPAPAKSLAASLQTPALDAQQISQDAQLIAQDVVTHLPAAQPVVDSRMAPVAEIVKAVTVNKQPAPQIIPNQLAANIKRSTKETPQMRLMFWQYPDVLVVDSLPTHTRGTLASAAYEKLLNNMILAMGMNASRIDAGSQPYVLNWPTLAGLSIDQGWDQAVSAVQYKLAKLLQNYSPKLVLMLGESSAQMLMNVEDDFEAMRGIVFSLRSDTKSITSYSLTQMLNIPGCKREVWQDLQKILVS